MRVQIPTVETPRLIERQTVHRLTPLSPNSMHRMRQSAYSLYHGGEMGWNYNHITVSGPQQDEIAAFLEREGRTAGISPTAGGITVVYARRFRSGWGRDISEHFACPA